MTTEREALKMALQALESLLDSFQRCEAGYPQHIEMRFAVRDTARIAIDRAKEALAQPEQEPVAYGMWDTQLGRGARMMMVRLDKGQDGCTVPLYTTPPQRKPLTFEQVEDCFPEGAIFAEDDGWLRVSAQTLHDYARAIEAAHGIKGEA